MRNAIAFAAVIIVFSIFMPDVLHAVETFLLVFFNTGTAVLQALPPATAQIGHVLR